MIGVLLAVLVTLLLVAGVTGNEELGEVGIDGLFLPVTAAAFLFGLRGALWTVGASLAVVLPLSVLTDIYTAEVVVTNTVLLLAMGGIVGRATDRLRAQTRILERRHELSLDLLATIRDRQFVVVNPVWERKLGYTPEELVGRSFLEFVHPDDRPQVEKSRVYLEEGGEINARASRFRHADGRYLWIEWSARHDRRDALVYITGRDITEKREAELALATHKEELEHAVAERTAELQHRTARLEELMSAMSHERREDLRRLAIVAEFRDDRTAAHTERVSDTAALIAEELGLPAETVELIRDAAPLHDIGKIGTPDAILLNPDRLTDAELQVMRQHTVLGAKILGDSRAPVLQVGAEIALNHHEWWDGSGYPNGIAGEEIPLAARIVALADVLDALTHARPYKPAWPLSDALDEIYDLSGRQFDPQVVGALHRLEERHALRLHEDAPAVPLRPVAAG